MLEVPTLSRRPTAVAAAAVAAGLHKYYIFVTPASGQPLQQRAFVSLSVRSSHNFRLSLENFETDEARR